MSDHDRGAYTPQSEAPLAFDARRPSERRPLPMTLIASGAVLLVILVALVMAYRSGVRGASDPKPVGTPVAAIKGPPEPGTTPAPEPAARMDVYAAQNVPAQAPNFAPAPEEPQPRPAPAAAPAAPPRLQVHAAPPTRVRIGPPEPAATPVPVPTPAERVGAATARTAIPAGAADRPALRPIQLARAEPPPAAPTLREAAKVAPPAAKAEAAPAPPPTAPKPKPVATGGTAVQIGAFSSRALAEKGYADAQGLIGGRMAGHARAVEPVERDGKTFYRATLTGFSDHAAAKAFCDELTGKGGRCLIKSGG